MVTNASAPRLNLYARIHKAQRAWLARCLLAAGRADASDTAAVEVACADVLRLVRHLQDHATHEERFIHPLLQEVAPQVDEMLQGDHRELDEAMSALAASARSRDIADVYGGLVLLTTRYFRHVEREETVATMELQQHFDDAALVERVIVPFNASRRKDEALSDVLMQLEGLNRAECGDVLALYRGS
jgi:hypothetical protein